MPSSYEEGSRARPRHSIRAMSRRPSSGRTPEVRITPGPTKALATVEPVFDRHRIGGGVSPYWLAFSLDGSPFSVDSRAHLNRGYSWRVEVEVPPLSFRASAATRLAGKCLSCGYDVAQGQTACTRCSHAISEPMAAAPRFSSAESYAPHRLVDKDPDLEERGRRRTQAAHRPLRSSPAVISDSAHGIAARGSPTKPWSL
jgi:hypothetical protein